ncbi:MAG: NtrZ family periplasmic regulatory protein [Hyphomonadaceae bacterium]
MLSRIRSLGFLLTAGLIALALGSGASYAQDAKPVDSVEPHQLPLIGSSGSDAAIPDWYQRFTFREGEAQNTVWTGASEHDVQYNWNKGERWQLQLAVTSREGDTGLAREQMEAGATFNITPRFSFGGSVSLGADDLNPGNVANQQQLETGIRLKSAFKF